MNRRKSYIALSGVLLVAVLALAMAFGVYGGQPDATGEEAALASGGGTKEGIHVSGHWTIDVREPDGTLAGHHEFDNAFEAGQSGPLVADVFSGDRTAGDWMIALWAVPVADSPWVLDIGYICESTTTGFCPSPDPSVSCDLSVSSPTYAVVLAGTIDAEENGRIDIVATRLHYCANTVSPEDCATGDYVQTFTQTTITPVEVSAGQQIAVTVQIVFS
jgi:hypothetical protein